jgi:hypothetical protein
MDDTDKFDFPKLHPKGNLHSSLRLKGTSDKGHAHAIYVFNTFRFTEVLDYHML